MVGKMLSHYRLVEKIGEGGMGVVWKAEDTVLGRTVAIKVLPADVALDAERRQLFLNEARLAASLSHAHIAQVHDLGREGDLDFIVMEYVEGQPLSRMLHGRSLPPDKVAEIGVQVAEGLARAHRKGLIHRDLKPANILITPDGDVKIVDFGLATLFSRPESTATLTATLAEATTGASIVGTLPYMSPEQMRGEKLDARSDIFSFGTVLYEMTTGRRPFQGSTPAEIVQEILRSQPTPVQKLSPKVPLDLLRVIDKALSRKPEDRYQTMDDAAVDLRRLQKEMDSGSWASYADMQRPSVPKPRRPWWRVAVSVAMLLVAAGAWVGRDLWKPGRDRGPSTGAPPSAQLPNWILVAEFDGPPGDPTLAIAARELISASLEQSQIVTPIPRSSLQRGLQHAMKPDTTRVAGAVARELAVRAAARSYVEGRVDRVLRGYSVVVRVRNADDDRVLISVNGLAENDELFIPTIDRLGRELRQGLGEKQTELLATRTSWGVITPSFEAYLMFVRAVELQRVGACEESNRLLRQALILDPNFATAWRLMAGNFDTLGFPDSARAALVEALRRPDRLTESGRLSAAAAQARADFDFPEVLKIYDLLLSENPFSPSLHNNRGGVLGFLGRYEEAHVALSRARDLTLFGPNRILLENYFETLMVLGRTQEAEVALRSIPGNARMQHLMLAMVKSEWARAESLAATEVCDPASIGGGRARAQLTLASLAASRGEVEQALRRLEDVAKNPPTPVWMDIACSARAQLWIVSRSDGLECGACVDTSTAASLIQGICAASQGQSDEARRIRLALEKRPSIDQRRCAVDLKLLDAWILASAGRWAEVVDLLADLRTQGPMPGFTGKLPIRWIVAEAYERQGQLDAAVEGFELVLTQRHMQSRRMGQEDYLRGIWYSFAHQRLVLLYARMGRAEEARRHWQIFHGTFTHPDPDLVPLVEQARRAIEGLKGAS